MVRKPSRNLGENEIIYIATDERNKTFFNAIAEHHQLLFLDDFKDLANLDDLDPNYMVSNAHDPTLKTHYTLRFLMFVALLLCLLRE
jgi:hypothetical protein